MDRDEVIRNSSLLLKEIQSNKEFRDGINMGMYGRALKKRYNQVLLSYPRLLFEESFVRGDTMLWRKSLHFDPELTVQPNSLVYLFNGYAESFKMQYVATEDMMAWKEWRDSSLRWDEYSHETFPSYHMVRQRGALLFSNQALPEVVSLESRLYKTNRGEIMPGSSGFMYEYELSSFR